MRLANESSAGRFHFRRIVSAPVSPRSAATARRSSAFYFPDAATLAQMRARVIDMHRANPRRMLS